MSTLICCSRFSQLRKLSPAWQRMNLTWKVSKAKAATVRTAKKKQSIFKLMESTCLSSERSLYRQTNPSPRSPHSFSCYNRRYKSKMKTLKSVVRVSTGRTPLFRVSIRDRATLLYPNQRGHLSWKPSRAGSTKRRPSPDLGSQSGKGGT